MSSTPVDGPQQDEPDQDAPDLAADALKDQLRKDVASWREGRSEGSNRQASELSVAVTRSTRSGRVRSTAERLTHATFGTSPAVFHRCTWRHASAKTHASRSPTSPDSSACGMNASGKRRP